MQHTAPPLGLGLLRDERGATAIVVALSLVALIGCASLGSEIVLLLATAQKMQYAADASAMAAVTARINGYPAEASQGAIAVAGASGFPNGREGTNVTVNIPPASGAYATTPDAVEVLISQPQNTPLASVVYPAGFVVRARGVARVTQYSACVLTLDGSADGSLTQNGTTLSDFPGCGVAINSTSARAVVLLGGAVLNAKQVSISGGYSLNGGAQINAPSGIVTGTSPVADPYAAYSIPSFGRCLRNNYNPPKGATTIPPGVYCNGITVNSGTALTLSPGTYIIDRGSLSVSGGATLSGSGVTIVLTSSTGSNYATVSIGSNATVTLSPPSTGATAGLVFFQDRNAPTSGSNSFNGGASQNITGALYFPEQNVQFSGGSSAAVCTQIVAQSITLTGNAVLQLACGGTGVLPIGGSAGLVE